MRELATTVVTLRVLAIPVRADEKKFPLGKVPNEVLAAANNRFSKAEVTGANKETNGGKLAHEVVPKVGGKKIDVTITPDGTVTLIEMLIEAADLPLEVVTALGKELPSRRLCCGVDDATSRSSVAPQTHPRWYVRYLMTLKYPRGPSENCPPDW